MTGLLQVIRLACVVIAAVHLMRGPVTGHVALLAANVSALAGIALKPHSVLTWLFVGIMIGLDIGAVTFAVVEREERDRDAKATRR